MLSASTSTYMEKERIAGFSRAEGHDGIKGR
jgi:hypothetical protein